MTWQATFFYSRSVLSNGPPVYFYHFDHLGSISFNEFYGHGTIKVLLGLVGKMVGYYSTEGIGVAHGDDLLYLFKYARYKSYSSWRKPRVCHHVGKLPLPIF